MRKFFLGIFPLLLISSALAFAQSAETLVIEVSLDQESLSSLQAEVKNFSNAAYSQFIKGLTMVSEISVHTAETDNELRKIQKRSQIEAATGLGSEDAAYATDKGSRALLALSFKVTPVGSNYQFSCMVSDIETRDSFQLTTKRLPIAELASDAVVDLLAYDVLSALQKRKYISELSLDVTNQLKHQEDTIENFQKYVDDYARQREEAERALADLRSASLSAEERLAAEDQERALQLKIEMAEKNRQIAEENLRRQQDEMLAQAQRQKDLESYSKGQREKFMKDIQAIEKARASIRKEGLSSLSLKKRIELIESAKVNLARLEQQLLDSVKDNNQHFDEKMNEEIVAKQAEPWRKADLSGDRPTQMAQNIRNAQIKEIREKYENQKKQVEFELRDSAQPGLDSYRGQISSNIADMEKTTYVFRSIDVTDDFLSLRVSDYDGNLSAWEVDSSFDLSSIPKVDSSAVILPKTTLSYTKMTGKALPKESDKNYTKSYQEYQDMVDMADLYFRTSVPYIYSQIAIKVHYEKASDSYVVTPLSFAIYKTQDNKTALMTYDQKSFENDKKQREQLARAELKRQQDEEERARQEEQNRIEAERKQRLAELKADEEQQRALEREYKRQERQASYHARRGVYFDFGSIEGPFYDGNSYCFTYVSGGKHIFWGIDAEIATASITDDYSEGAYADSMIFGLADLLVGCSVQFGRIFRPYIAAGFGGYDVESDAIMSDDDSESPAGLALVGMTGLDLVLGHFVVGGVYKMRYFNGAGFVDNFALSIGFTW